MLWESNVGADASLLAYLAGIFHHLNKLLKGGGENILTSIDKNIGFFFNQAYRKIIF